MSKARKTADDKKDILLRYIQGHKSFYTLQELEICVAREGGLAEKQIKDVLQKLLDDGSVQSVKSGKTMFYWSNPHQELHDKRARVQALQSELAGLNETLLALQRPPPEKSLERDMAATENVMLKSRLSQLEAKALSYEDTQQVEVVAKKKAQIPKLHEAANRWTDNVFTMKSWIKQRMNCEDTDIEKQFGIPSNFDYLEDPK